MENEKLRTILADQQHNRWSKWMRYMFSQGILLEDGTWCMPKEKVDRWVRQMNTSFYNLPSIEKTSDYNCADDIIKILHNLDVDNNTVICPACDIEICNKCGISKEEVFN